MTDQLRAMAIDQLFFGPFCYAVKFCSKTHDAPASLCNLRIIRFGGSLDAWGVVREKLFMGNSADSVPTPPLPPVDPGLGSHPTSPSTVDPGLGYALNLAVQNISGTLCGAQGKAARRLHGVHLGPWALCRSVKCQRCKQTTPPVSPFSALWNRANSDACSAHQLVAPFHVTRRVVLEQTLIAQRCDARRFLYLTDLRFPPPQ